MLEIEGEADSRLPILQPSLKPCTAPLAELPSWRAAFLFKDSRWRFHLHQT